MDTKLIGKTIDPDRGKYSNLGFTTDQQIALEFLDKWLRSNKPVATLTGAAGTGKTFILKYFLDNVVTRKTVISSTTHKALRVLEKRTNRKGFTLHSIHGLRPNIALESFSINNMIFDPMADPKMRYYSLVIIDECSQINRDLYDLTESRAKQYGCKVLYVGDKYQLPPIREKLSKCFSNTNMIELKEVVRQSEGNKLLDLFDIVRYDIDRKSVKFISYIKNNPNSIKDGQGFILANSNSFTTAMKEDFSGEAFSKDVDHCRYIAYTNDSINKVNHFIRDAIINNKEVVNIHDLFTGYRTIVDNYLNPIITNSEDYVIDSVNKRQSEHGFGEYMTEIKDLGLFSNRTIGIVDHRSPDYENYVNIIRILLNSVESSYGSSKATAWRKYFEFKDRYLSVVDLKIDNQTVKRDLDYGYGLTSHKSQGSTYDRVYINLRDIAYHNGKLRYDISMINRLFYVAASRASNLAIIYL